MSRSSPNERLDNELIPTRASLLSRLRNVADQEGWQEFFDTYSDLIFRIAVKSGLSAADAEEVVQETVIGVARKLPDFRYDPSKGSFKHWLLNMTRWRIVDRLRRLKGERDFEQLPDGTEGTSPINRIPAPGKSHMESMWDDEWRKNLAKTAYDRLKSKVEPKKYQIFDLYVVQGWPVQRIVETLKVNPARVYLIAHRVSRLVKKEIKELENGLL